MISCIVPLFVNIYLLNLPKQCELLLYVTDVISCLYFAMFWMYCHVVDKASSDQRILDCQNIWSV